MPPAKSREINEQLQELRASIDYQKSYVIQANKVAVLEENLKTLKEKLLDKKPSHFSKKDVARAFFGSLVFGFTFALKGALIQTALNLTIYNILALILSTIVVITIEIYYIGYRRIPLYERKKRKFGQFWLKRATTYYLIALLVSAFLIFVYNINRLPPVNDCWDTFRIIISVSMPAAIGATIADLLKQY